MLRLGRVLLCAGALSVTLQHEAPPASPKPPYVAFSPLPELRGAALARGLTIEEAWQLSSNLSTFGGYSALVTRTDGSLLAISDEGAMFTFSDPSKPLAAVKLGWLKERPPAPKELRDTESATIDNASDRMWVGYEYRNALARFDLRTGAVKRIYPPEMQFWGLNSGAEAMARLADGSLLVLAEERSGRLDKGAPGLVFAHDPVEGGKPRKFYTQTSNGLNISDMAALPDGRVIVLGRRLAWPLPTRFDAGLMLADPSDIRTGQAWKLASLANLDDSALQANYEGIAVQLQPDGTLVLWLISDDNMSILQRNYLLKLRWRNWRKQAADPQQEKGAQADPARPSAIAKP